MLLDVRNLEKVYTSRFSATSVRALNGVRFQVEKGEFIAIMGESGAGKTTLLNILAALDRPTSGEILLNGKSLKDIAPSELAAFRREHLGFVFQDFNLLDTLSVRDNIYLPLVLSGTPVSEMEKRLRPIVKRLRIAEILPKFPYEISGGQKQRTAIARALITSPDIILADEPTGALDSKASSELLTLFQEINALGQTILMVTHSARAASRSNRVLFIKDGVVFHQLYRGERDDEEMFRAITESLTLLSAGGDQNA